MFVELLFADISNKIGKGYKYSFFFQIVADTFLSQFQLDARLNHISQTA